MAVDFLSDLIQDINIRLRQAAGIPSYDPDNSTLPPFPSIAELVSTLDPNLPDFLRCKRCRGGLCRGINSTICIFCSAEQRGEGNIRTISFNSTLGYQKLIQSLDLDGSEMVHFEAEPKNSSKGRDSSKSRLTLSKFLDLELKWPLEVDEFDKGSNNSPSQRALVSLSGVDLDKFFLEQKNEVSSRSNAFHTTSKTPQMRANGMQLLPVDLNSFIHKEPNINTQDNLSSTSQKLDFIERRKSLGEANSPANAKRSDFDDTLTDFQSTNSATFEAKFQQIDLFQNSAEFCSANLSAVADESIIVGLIPNAIDYQSANNEAVSIIDSSISSTFVCELEIEEKEETSASVASIQDDLQHSSADKIDTMKGSTLYDDDALDEWQDYTTAENVTGNLSSLGSLDSDNFPTLLPSEVNLGNIDIGFSQNSVKKEDDSAEHRLGKNNDAPIVYKDSMVDTLLAQMPDLSFMLEESLYIPKKLTSPELNT